MTENNLKSCGSDSDTSRKSSSRRMVLPDSRWSWLVICGNLVIGMLTLGYFRCLSVFFRPLMLEFDVMYGSVALIPGLYCFGFAPGSLALPHLTKRFGNRKTCFVAAVALCTLSIISSLSNNLVIIQIFFGFVSGFCGGLLFFTSLVTSSQYIHNRRSLATSIATIGVPLTALAFPPVLDQMVTYFGWRGAMLISSGILLHGCVSASLYLPVALTKKNEESRDITLQDKHKKPENEEKLSEDGTETRNERYLEKENSNRQRIVSYDNSSSRNTIELKNDHDTRKKDCCVIAKLRISDALDLSLFRIPAFVCAMLSSITYFSGYVCTNTFLIPYGMDRLNLDGLQATFILTGASAAECAAKIVHGFLGDFKCVSRPLLLSLMSTLCSVLVVSIPKCENFSTLLVVAIIYGMMASGYHGVMPVVICDIVGPARLATAIGYKGFLYSCLLAPSLYLMGYIVDETGDIRIPFYICSGLLFMSAICLLTIHILQRRKQRTAS